MDYFRVYFDSQGLPDQWFLGEPFSEEGEQLDAREFRYGKPYRGPRPVRVPIEVPGRPAAFHLGAFDIAVVSDQAVEILRRVCPDDIETFPVMVGTAILGYQIVNAHHSEACVDEQRSVIEWFEPGGIRPDLVGQYSMIYELVVDAAKTNGRHLFHIRDFEVAMIASEVVRDALIDIPDLGVAFESVT